MAARTASSSSTGDRSPERKASTSEQASPARGVRHGGMPSHSSTGRPAVGALVLGSAPMDARTWLGLEPTHNPIRWVLPVTPGISTGALPVRRLRLGAAIEALEGTTGPAGRVGHRAVPVLRPAAVDARHRRHRRRPAAAITQARAVGHVADTEILTVNAALGPRRPPGGGAWGRCPTSPPRRLPPRPRVHRTASRSWTASTRLASPGRPWDEIEGHPATDGRSSLWARMPDLLDMSAPASPSSATTCPSASARRSAARRRQQPRQHAAGATGWCRPSGCCSTSGSTPSPTGSATASCTSGPRTARCWPRPASRRSSA